MRGTRDTSSTSTSKAGWHHAKSSPGVPLLHCLKRLLGAQQGEGNSSRGSGWAERPLSAHGEHQHCFSARGKAWAGVLQCHLHAQGHILPPGIPAAALSSDECGSAEFTAPVSGPEEAEQRMVAPSQRPGSSEPVLPSTAQNLSDHSHPVQALQDNTSVSTNLSAMGEIHPGWTHQQQEGHDMNKGGRTHNPTSPTSPWTCSLSSPGLWVPLAGVQVSKNPHKHTWGRGAAVQMHCEPLTARGGFEPPADPEAHITTTNHRHTCSWRTAAKPRLQPPWERPNELRYRNTSFLLPL